MAKAENLLWEAACLSRQFPYPFPTAHSNPGHDSSHMDLEAEIPGKKKKIRGSNHTPMKPPRKKPKLVPASAGLGPRSSFFLPPQCACDTCISIAGSFEHGEKKWELPSCAPCPCSPCLQPSRPGYYFHSKQHNKQQQEDFIPSVCGLFPLEILILMSSPIDFHPFKR